MTQTLWFKFPDETAAALVFNDAEKAGFERIFSVDDQSSAWNRALDILGLGNVSKDKLLYWHDNTPYFNWSSLIGVISGGAIKIVRRGEGGYGFQVSYAPRNLWRLFSGQWKAAKFLQKKFPPEDALAESIALGLVLQTMILRLGKQADQNLPQWLSGAVPIPARYKKTVEQMQAVQVRRTALSPVWRGVLPKSEEHAQSLPEYFWNDPSGVVSNSAMPVERDKDVWTGLSVCAGKISGKVVVVKSVKNTVIEKGDMPLILVFKRARPETVELYPNAAAVVFAEGGILSHACVVAREMNLPAVTGLGMDFFDDMTAQDGVIVTVDGTAGTVTRV